MKKLIYLLLILPFFINSCGQDDNIGALNYTALDSIVAEAKATADISKEGDKGGDLFVGTTDILNKAIAKYEAYRITAINQGTVDNAVKALTIALETYNNSVVEIDFSALITSISLAQSKLNAAIEGTNVGNQIIGSKAILQTAINAAQAVANNANTTQSSVNQANVQLKAAVALFETSVIKPLNLTELNNTIAVAQALHDSAVEGTNSGQYAAGSKAILQNAINAAKAAANNQTLNQVDIDNAKQTLNQAITNFEAGKVVPPSFLSFKGDDYIKVNGFKGVSGGGVRTCEAWINTTSTDFNIVIMSWGIDASNQKWDVRLNNGSNALRVEYNGGGVVGTTNLTDGKWHHIAIVVPNSNVPLTSVLLYVDGVLEVKAAASGSAPINTSPDNDFQIGRSAGHNGRYWLGGITDVRVWNVARTASEIANNKNIRLTGNEPGLIGYFKLNEGTGTSAFDSSTNGNTGTLGGDIGVSAVPEWTAVTSGFPF